MLKEIDNKWSQCPMTNQDIPDDYWHELTLKTTSTPETIRKVNKKIATGRFPGVPSR
jgi:hypothetical protein